MIRSIERSAKKQVKKESEAADKKRNCDRIVCRKKSPKNC